ncbi:MAG: hypothetical protein ACI959_000103 [Limisphaerales bacterium]|jgi:hypothetical protein
MKSLLNRILLLNFLLIFSFSLFAQNNSELKNWFVPFPGTPSIFQFQTEPGNNVFRHLRSIHDDYMITEITNSNGQLVEYLDLRFDEKGGRIESYTTYTLDSTGRTTPIFTEFEDSDYFRWDWPKELTLMMRYKEPRKMDSRTKSIKVSKERILLDDIDTMSVLGRMVPVRHTNDLIRLEFIDKAGEKIGEDFLLEFRTWAYGLGLVEYRRQFSDGNSLAFKLMRMMELE